MDENRPQDVPSEVKKEDEIGALLDEVIGRIRAIRFCVESILHRMEVEE